MSEYIWPIVVLILGLLGFVVVIVGKVFEAIRKSHELGSFAVETAMASVEDSYRFLSRKTEVWHENAIAAANANAERLSETFLAAEDERYANVLAHSKERLEAAGIAASKSTNEKLAELNEAKSKADATATAKGRTQVRPSAASKSRAKENAGAVAERHQTR